jgi:hypothetical protein
MKKPRIKLFVRKLPALIALSLTLASAGAYTAEAAITLGTEEQVSPSNKAASIAGYNTSILSPDGAYIMYNVYDTIPTTENAFDSELIKRPVDSSGNLGTPESLYGGTGVTFRTPYHNGGKQVWINSTAVAAVSGKVQTRIFNTSGTLFYTVNTGGLGLNAYNFYITLTRPAGGNLSSTLDITHATDPSKNHSVANGVYKFKQSNGDLVQLMTIDGIYNAINSYDSGNAGDKSKMDFDSAVFSKNGRYVQIGVDTYNSSGSILGKYVVSSDTSLGLNGDIKVFGKKDSAGYWKAPLHPVWANDVESELIGVDRTNGNKLTRYTRAGAVSGVVATLSGGVMLSTQNHPSLAPQADIYASDNYYDSNPLVLKIWHEGVDQEEVFSISDSNLVGHRTASGLTDKPVWGLSAHVNTVFVTHGTSTYIYYNKPFYIGTTPASGVFRTKIVSW